MSVFFLRNNTIVSTAHSLKVEPFPIIGWIKITHHRLQLSLYRTNGRHILLYRLW